MPHPNMWPLLPVHEYVLATPLDQGCRFVDALYDAVSVFAVSVSTITPQQITNADERIEL